VSEPTVFATFMFTDIEASTRRWEHDAAAMSAALAHHDEVVRTTVLVHEGTLLKHTGDGVLAMFDRAADALAAAVSLQRAMSGEQFRIRIGIHAGAAEHRDGDYFGPTLNRAARIMTLARGGHVIASSAVATLVGNDLPADTALLDIGEHQLKDVARPERLCQVIGAGFDDPLPAARPLEATPAARTFVGRHDELEQLVGLVHEHRLLTLTGVGGSGKTRLALELARRVGDRFADGVAVVELAPLSDPGEVVSTVASALDMPVVGSSIDRDLITFLRARSCLLVLDNCEHLLDACADLADALLSGCPGVVVLATSREPLAVDGERSWRIPSLSLPDDESPLDSEAAQLFVTRARSARADFDAAQHLGAIAEICRRLDGLPLAIELAAARTAHLTAEQIATMLDDRFTLLTGGARRARQRQQTLQATMDWSHDLLGEHEQHLLRALAVFTGGCSLEAVLDVCADIGAPVTLIDGLGSLVDKSLLIADETRRGEMRYRMLETVRLYAQDRLVESGQAAERRDRHLDWMARRVDAVAEHSPHIADVADAIEPELDNLRAALDWAQTTDRPALVATLITDSWPAWWELLRSTEAIRRLAPAVAVCDGAMSPSARAGWRAALGMLAMEEMDGATITRCSSEILELDPRCEHHRWSGLAWMLRAMILHVVDPERVLPDLVAAREIESPIWHRDLSQVLKLWEGFALCSLGRAAEAQHAFASIVDAPDQDRVTHRFARLGSAVSLHMLGRDVEAMSVVPEVGSADFGRPGRHVDVNTPSLLAVLHTSDGDPDAGRASLAHAVAVLERRYLHIQGTWGHPTTAAAAMLALAGHDDEAMRLLVGIGAGRRAWQVRSEVTLGLHRHYSRVVAARLGDAAMAEAWRDGSTMTDDDVKAVVRAVIAGR
jgi:predicted ATPase/class 3 adenylate cyclase